MKLSLTHPILTTMFALLTAALSFMSYYTWPRRPLPEEKQFALQLPANADIRPASDVEPGTFKIHVSLEELLAKSRSGQFGNPIVAYGENEYGKLHIQYWLPRNDGTFYYADVAPGQEPWGRRHFWIGVSWQVKNATLVATPQGIYTTSFISAGLALLMLYLGIASELAHKLKCGLFPFYW